MRRNSDSPEAYRADVPEPLRGILEQVRRVVRAVAPASEEGIRYGMLDYPGVANLAAQKGFVALYVAPTVLDAHRAHFPGVNAGKSCLRFRRPEQVDAGALEALLRDVLAQHEAGRGRRSGARGPIGAG